MPTSGHSWFSRLLSGLPVAILAACSAQAPAARAAVAPAPTPVVRVPWPRFAEVAAWPALPSAPFASQGHPLVGASARVRINPESTSAYLGLVRDSFLPDGTLVALFHESAATEPGPVYVMSKDAGTWSYLVLDARGNLEKIANLSACAGCHAEAVADHLFGLPRPRPAPSKP